MATRSSILAWRIPKDKGAWRATVHGVTESLTPSERLSTHTYTRPARSHSGPRVSLAPDS